MAEEGSLYLAVFTALALIGALVLERLVIRRWRPRAYFRVGLPLFMDLVPIPSPPKGEGQTATVCWQVVDESVHFWAPVGERTAPSGLHGLVQMRRSADRVHLTVRWSPPWSYLLAALWLVGLGILRGQVALTATISGLLVAGVLLIYHRFALRAARELRWSFVRDDVES